MKKCLAALLLLCFLILPAFAETLSSEVKIYSESRGKLRNLTDEDESTGDVLSPAKKHVIEIRPGTTPVCALSFVFGRDILPFTVQTKTEEGWKDIAAWERNDMAMCTVHFDAQSEPFRVVFTAKEASKVTIREIYPFGEGMTDERMRGFNPPCEKADLMTIVAHPDDEILWFGGTIPYYAGQMGKHVQAVYMTCGNYQRRIELLDGLWHCGVRDYPEIGYWFDGKLASVDTVYSKWGKQKTLTHLVRLLRRYRPDVVLTHADNGEYGHVQHLTVTDAVEQAVTLAADESYDAESVQMYGTWQVKKLYKHLGKENVIYMDYDQALPAFDGKTAYQIACEAFDFHLTQHTGRWHVHAPGEIYESTRYTLVMSTVGEDVLKNDLFENID